MASPLNVFRKYQKQIMVPLFLIAMFTFVVGTPIAIFLSSGGGSTSTADKTVVTWKGGKLNESGLYLLRQNHHLLLNFLAEVEKKAAESKGTPKATPIDRAGSEEDLVLRVVKARKAEELGLVISDETMITYLELLSDNSLTRTQFNRVMNEATGGRLDERTMFMQLRTELLAQRLEALALGDWRQELNRVRFGGEQPHALPPAVAWDYFGRIHRRVRAEMYPLKTANFLDEVKGEPTESQIQKLYDDHKDKPANPFSAEPGFKRYTQAAFQYVKVDVNKFTTEEKAKVTDKQIEEYYEKNKDTSYVEVDLPELPGDKKSDDKKTEEEKSDDKKTDEEKTDEEKTDEKKKPEEKKPDEAKPDDKPKADKPEGCQDEEPAKKDPTKDEPAKTEPKKDEPDKTDEPKTETPEKKSGEDGEKPAKPKKKEVKYKPLNDKLKEEIRGLIASPIANERFSKGVKTVQDAVRDYSREYRRWEAETKANLKNIDPKPELIDVKKLARSLGMSSGQTPLVDPLVMIEDAKRDKPKYDLSRAQQFDQNRFGWNDFAMVAFGAGAPLFEAQTARLASKEVGGEEIYFIFWRTEEKPAYVPDLKEARPAVIAVWRQQEAYKLALAAAETLAKSVTTSGKSIKESLPASEASETFETDAFSWLSRNTPMGAPGQLGISRIKKQGAGFDDEAVESVGDDFMEAVFSLKPGECGVAVNEPKSIVCVVQVIDEPISEELLMQMFLDSTNKSEIYMLALRDRGRQLGDWQDELEKEMALKWERDPEANERG